MSEASRGPIAAWLHSALFENLGLKFLSMVLAVTVFLLVNTDKDREVSATVKVSYTMPDDRVLVSERLDAVHLQIRGPWRKLRRFDEVQLDRLNLDLRHTETGEIALTPDMVSLPSGLTIVSMSPRTLRVQFDKRSEKVVEVAPVTSPPPHGYIVTSIKSAPATVTLRGAETALNGLLSVATREISLDNHTEPFTETAEVVPPKGIELESSQRVQVQIHIEQKLIVRDLPNQGVQVAGADGKKWAVTPAQVDVSVTGAQLAVESAVFTPVVKVVPSETKPREAVVTIEGLPPGVGVKVSPERVTIAPVR